MDSEPQPIYKQNEVREERKMGSEPRGASYKQQTVVPMVFVPVLMFDDASVRRAFVRKVFSLVGIMLAVCTFMVALSTLHDGTRNFFRRHVWLYYVAMILFIALYLVIVCVKAVRKAYPCNIITLAAFTLVTGLMLMVYTAHHKQHVVLIVFGITVLSCVGIILFAMQTRIDITGCGFLLFVCCMVLCLFSIIVLIMSFFMDVKILHMILCGLSAVLFMVYLAYDVQLIVGGRRHEISPDEYIYASVTLFVDIIYIFMNLLGLGGAVAN